MVPGPAPDIRVRLANAQPVRPERDEVLYWITGARRTRWSFGLQHALARAHALGKPLRVLDALRCDYPWASDRHHAFALAGMRDVAARVATAGIAVHSYVEPARGHGRGLLRALAERACIVITDDPPAFFMPRMIAAAAAQLDVRLECVDGSGLLPLRAATRTFTTAASFRRHLHKTVMEHLLVPPLADPLGVGGSRRPALPRATPLPEAIARRWPSASPAELEPTPARLATLPIDHAVAPVPAAPGGERAAQAVLATFVRTGLGRYADERNTIDDGAASGLSPWLHWGHMSAHEVFAAVADADGWSPDKVATRPTGQREGWWGMSRGPEAFVDELVTWREVGLNMAATRPDDHAQWDALPPWAKATLHAHASDPRPWVYDRAQLEGAHTHDELWNAAQRQLVREGVIHNYLRMLWGKKVLEWSEDPREALKTLLALNDRWALDGRDANSVSGVFWVFGRYDRAWGPERPIFGKIRYMSSDSTRRKLNVRGYLTRYAAQPPAATGARASAPRPSR